MVDFFFRDSVYIGFVTSNIGITNLIVIIGKPILSPFQRRIHGSRNN